MADIVDLHIIGDWIFWIFFSGGFCSIMQLIHLELVW